MQLDESKNDELCFLTDKEVSDICEEIEIQWEYHLMTRAIFNSKFPKFIKYSTLPFYRSIGNIEVTLPEPNERTEAFNRAAKGIGYWHNQNYAIRLFGIVNKHGILRFGKTNEISVMILLDSIRNNVGAHSSGRRIASKAAFRDSILLINELFKTSFDAEKEMSYPLAIDAVLEPLKDQVVEFIESLNRGR